MFTLYETDKLPRKAPGTQRTYRECLKPFREYFVGHCKDPAVEKVRKAHIEGYLAWRAVNRVGGGVVGNRMLSKERAVLHAIFAFAGKLELCAGNPVKESDNPKWDRREPIILDDAQYEKLLTACEGHAMLRLHVLTLAESGLRCGSECLWLRWEDIEDGFLYIVTGRDNEESFDSCSHGAGRRMSRRRAKETISLAQFREKMYGIYSESVNKSHLDEAPSAYKKIDEVMERQKDLVEIQTRLEPIMNIKG